MKKQFLTLAVIIMALASCNSTSESAASTDSTVAAETEMATGDGHTSRNSLDYAGTYTGVLPCADCEGIETQITLDAEGTFTKKTTYLGKSTPNVFEKQGIFSWDADGQRITLEGQQKPNQYFVGENTLTQLDIEGQKIEGSLSGMYVLKK